MLNKKIVEYIEENDVKFVRLGFCDPFGNYKNISIMAEEIDRAFKEGISFDASAVEGFSDINESDLLLFPQADTVSLLPWRPYTNSVLRLQCNIKHTDKTQFLSDGRYMLQTAMNELSNMGFSSKMGSECEFYLFKTDEDEEPLLKTIDNGGYLDIAPKDKGENIRREICLCLDEMGLKPERSHHEQGPGQNEIDFKFSDPLSTADNFLTFKSVVKSIASRNGYFASFMPKPFLNKPGSGMHINMSLYKNGKNLSEDHNGKDFKYVNNFIAGILEKIPEITLFLNPTNNSYERFGKFEAPKYISWSHKNRSQLIRIPTSEGNRARFELRSPDSTLNPYIAFSLLIYAGIYGIKNDLQLPKSIDENLYTAPDSVTEKLNELPKDLSAAVELAQSSEFVKKYINEELLNKYIDIKKKECAEYKNAKDKEIYYINRYFTSL